MKVLITGANGQLGQEMQHLLDERGQEYLAEDSQGLDITDKEAVDAYFEKNKPEVVYHCAAYTAVDKAEGEGKELNWKVNVDGTENIAKACQKGRPTLTRTLAEFLTYLVDNKIEYGVYHCCNDGQCSWYEFAKEILKDTDVDVQPVTSDQYPTAAFRPHYSVMKLAKETGFVFPDWKEALDEFLSRVKK